MFFFVYEATKFVRILGIRKLFRVIPWANARLFHLNCRPYMIRWRTAGWKNSSLVHTYTQPGVEPSAACCESVHRKLRTHPQEAVSPFTVNC